MSEPGDPDTRLAGADASEPLDLRTRLERESGVAVWPDLVRHFARGSVIKARPGVDLVEIAVAIAEDDTARVGRWLEDGTLERAGDDDARAWSRPDRRFHCVVVAPWVLVQVMEAHTATLH